MVTVKSPPFYSLRGNLWLTLIASGLMGFINNLYAAYAMCYTINAEESFRAYLNESYVSDANPAGLSESEALYYWDVILNGIYLGWLVGNFITPPITDIYGRKAALIFSNVATLLSNVLSTAGIYWYMPSLFLVGRFAGFAFNTTNFAAVTLIIMESTTVAFRGTANFVAGTTFPLGMVVGMAAGMDGVFGQKLTLLVGVCNLFLLLAVVTSFFVPESPKYLLLVKKDREAALESLVFYQGLNVDHEVLLDEIQAEEEEGESAAEGKGHLLNVIKELFTRRVLRNSMLLGLVAMQLTVGIYSIQTEVLLAHFPEDQAQLYSTILFALGAIAGIVGIFAMEKMKRRTLIIASAAANVAAITAYVVLDRLSVYVSDGFKWGLLISLAVYSGSFSGVGILANYVAGELLPQRYRSTGQSLVFATSLLINFSCMLVILPAYERFSVYAFIPLLVLPGVYAVLHLWLYLPETNGKETHEVVQELRRRYGSDVNAIAPPPPKVLSRGWGMEEADLGMPKY